MTSAEEEKVNKLNQQLRVVEYLEQMPVVQLSLEGQEADDLVAWLCCNDQYKDWSKIIVSSDKDFIQLCDDKTVLYRPVAKEILNKKRVIEKFGIHPNNFALARSLVGDASDNIKGVKGVGLKTVAKRLPFLIEEKSYSVKDVLSFSKDNEKTAKVFQKILEEESVIQENYDLMQLYLSNIPDQGRQKLLWALKNTGKEFSKYQIRVMMRQDGIMNVNIEEMLSTMSRWDLND